MEFKLETGRLSAIDADILVVGIFEGEKPQKVIARLDKSFPPSFLRQIAPVCSRERFQGKANKSVPLHTYGSLTCKKLVLWGLGKSSDYSTTTSRKMAATVARSLAAAGTGGTVCFFLRAEGDGSRHAQALIEGWVLGSYSFVKYKSSNDDKPKMSVDTVTIGGAGLSGREFATIARTAQTIAAATNLARDLINEPAAVMTPTRLAQEARRVARESGLTCTVMGADDAGRLGMGAFLGVARGAKEAPKFIVLKYNPPRAKKRLAVVGKGITFDSGGLSLKPAQSMEYMKYDMSGAAAVIATMQVVGKLKPPVAVIGVAAATENMPGGSALHPGDVLVAMNGKTIEVNNTDAEGRLILADALCYACKQKPDEVVDIATLTGACVTALGRVAAGVMGNDQKLIDRLLSCAQEAGEKLWQLPLFDEYKETLKSDIADLKNAGSRGEAGTSSAALFLREFVEGPSWAHLDIAGPGWLEKERDELNKGGTAFGVRTLCRYILSYK
jgi:leucyl aminopeptidase